MVDYKDRLEWAMINRPGGSVDITAMARHLGLSYQAVRKVVRGESKSFTAENNEKAAAWLMVNSRWLATGRGDIRQDKATVHTASDRLPNSLETPPAHQDRWIAEAIATLQSMTPDDRRAAVLNLRVFVANLNKPSDGQALPVAA